MSIQQLTSEALALPLDERVSLARALWESIEGDDAVEVMDEKAVMAEVLRRDQELSSGAVEELTHEEVMAEARRALGCA